MSLAPPSGPLPRYTRAGQAVSAGAVLGAAGGERLDAEGLSELLLAGGIVSGRTLVRGVRRCQAWSRLVLESLGGEDRHPQADILELLRARLEDLAEGGASGGWLLALSGGRDARILAGLAAPWRPACLTFGWTHPGPDAPDEPRLAARVAEALGLVQRSRIMGDVAPLEEIPGRPPGWSHLAEATVAGLGGASLADLLAIPSHGLDLDGTLLLSGFGGDALLGPARQAPQTADGYRALLDPCSDAVAGLLLTPVGVRRTRGALEGAWRGWLVRTRDACAGVGQRRVLDLLVRQQLLNAPGLGSRAAFVPVAAPFTALPVVRAACSLEDERDQRPGLLARLQPALSRLPTTPWGLPAGAPDTEVARRRRQRRRRLRLDRWLARAGLRPRPARGAVIDLAARLRQPGPLAEAMELAVLPERWGGLEGLRPEGPAELLQLHRQGYRNVERTLLRLLLVAGLRERLEGTDGPTPLLGTASRGRLPEGHDPAVPGGTGGRDGAA